MQDNDSPEDALAGSNLSRHYDPQDMHDLMDDYGHEGKQAVRDQIDRLDGGRFAEMLEAAHRLFAHADFDGRDHLFEMFSGEMRAWISVYARAQDLAWLFVSDDADE